MKNINGENDRSDFKVNKLKRIGTLRGRELSIFLRDLVEGNQNYKDKINIFKKLILERALVENHYIVEKTAVSLKKNRTALYRELADLDVELLR